MTSAASANCENSGQSVAYERAFSTLGCPELQLEEVFALAFRHGITAVELRALGGITDLPAYFLGKYGNPEVLADWARRQPVRIIALDTSLRLAGGVFPDERAQFLRLVPWAEALGVPRLRVFDGGDIPGNDPLPEMGDVIAWWREARHAHGWRTDIMVETHDSLLRGEVIRKFCAQAPGTGILWDAHHTWQKGGEDPRETWAMIRGHVAHIHVKDSIPAPGVGGKTAYQLPGAGEFPMRSLQPVLAREFTGPVSLEWERHWHPELAPLDQALANAFSQAWW